MGWSGTCRKGGGYVVGADGGGVAAVRPPPPFLQSVAAAAGLLGGKFWPLQGRYIHPSFNGAAAVEYSLCYLQVLLLLF